MKPRSKYVFLLVIAIFVVLYKFTGCDFIDSHRKAKELIVKCTDQLKIGMTKSEVIKIMGEPQYIEEYESDEDDRTKERLKFIGSADFDNDPIRVDIDKETGLVDLILCYESYGVSK